MKEGKKEQKQITRFDSVNIWAVNSTHMWGSNGVTDSTAYLHWHSSQRDPPWAPCPLRVLSW